MKFVSSSLSLSFSFLKSAFGVISVNEYDFSVFVLSALSSLRNEKSFGTSVRFITLSMENNRELNEVDHENVDEIFQLIQTIDRYDLKISMKKIISPTNEQKETFLI